MNPLAVDVKTAAEMLGVSVDTVRHYIERGRIPVVRFPSSRYDGERSRRVLLAVSDLEAFVAANRETHAPDPVLSEASVKGWKLKPVRRAS